MKLRHLICVLRNDGTMDTERVREIVKTLKKATSPGVAEVGHCYKRDLRGIAISLRHTTYRYPFAALDRVWENLPEDWRGERVEWILITPEEYDEIFASTP